jgi:hypothetical protein
MPGVPRRLIEHSLNVDPKATPKRQQLRRFTDDRWDAIKKELVKLLATDFIREVFHPEWLANPILVRKKNSNEWRMCVDYTDLNKHCPKDPFGLPRIDQVIDSMAGCDLLYFLDCYSGCHQIAIKEDDQEKTAFITPFGAYCYTTMSIRLKNVGATYHDDRRGLATTLHRLHPRVEGSFRQELGRAARSLRQVLCSSRRQALQEGRHFWSTHEVRPREEGKDILEEIHKGVCDNHASSRTLVSKAFRRAFYWPIALVNSLEDAKGVSTSPSNSTSRPTS